MDNMDDPETTAKISDSAYSNSCSNSQSRRSHSSKSTHSGSNSSGSSGYGGKASTSGSSNTLGQPPKKDKDSKKKKLSQTEVKAAEIVADAEPARPAEPDPVLVTPNEKSDDVVETAMTLVLPEEAAEDMDTTAPDAADSKEMNQIALQPVSNAENFVTSRPPPNSSDGFSCVISMHDGVVMYTSASLTTTLGFPKDIWIGRSFIDFVHPKDHKTFASLITNGLALPKLENGKYSGNDTGLGLTSGSTMVCRIRRYRSLNKAFGVKDAVVTFMPFMLKFFFKDYNDEDIKVIYLVIQATPFFSAFKTSNELVSKPVQFVIRHAADGALEYIDPESIPYLGYLPQDIQERNALHLYHPDDLPYLRHVYEIIVREGSVSSCRPYRIMTQNGDYIRVETEWSTVINPWSKKLEFVIAKHHIIEGPVNPDVFQSPEPEKNSRMNEAENCRKQAFRDSIIRVMNEARTKPAETAKQQMGKRCQDLASFMETLIEETPKQDEDLRLELQHIQERDLSYYERDSVMLGGISPHHDSDSKSSVETPLSYNQLNYNENLQRFFDSQVTNSNELQYVDGNNEPILKSIRASSSFSPLAQKSNEYESSNSSAVALYVNSPGTSTDYQYVKITESMIHKHNAEMEKELVKMHRELRSSKGDREKASHESRKKKKEHLARCNASFHPTSAGESVERPHRQQGVKRASKPQYNDTHQQKHHCPSTRKHRERHRPHILESASPLAKPSFNMTTTVATTQWPTVQTVNSFNMFGMGIPPQMPMMTHLPTISVASTGQAMPTSGAVTTGIVAMPGTSAVSPMPGSSSGPIPVSGHMKTPNVDNIPGTTVMASMPCTSVSGVPPMAAAYGLAQMPTTAAMSTVPVMPGMHVPYVVHGHPISMVYGQPFMYSAINNQIYPMQQSLMAQHSMHYSGPMNPMGLATSNYEQVRGIVVQSTELVGASSSTSNCGKSKPRTSDENADRTDGESSYSSFYSSFFKTDSGSAEDSGDQKNKPNIIKNRFWTKNVQGEDAMSFQSSTEADSNPKRNNKKLARRKMNAPWNEKVNLTSELIYKYQLLTQPVQEVLKSDQQKIAAMEQPALVNEQLGQLYLDLQLQGVAARLTLEEGVTSSSSSGEEVTPMSSKTKRKREFSKLTIIHEENAPMPAPDSGFLIPEEPAEKEAPKPSETS